MTKAQEKLINLSKANGGVVVTVDAGQKVTARKLQRLGLMRLSGINEYTLVEAA